MEFTDCASLAKSVRLDCLRMVFEGRSGHIGSMLSCADLLAVLYKKILKVDPASPKAEERDRLIFSKGHGGAALFATLAELGFFPKDWLWTYYKDGGKLSGHISHHVPGVEFSTGSLGHGLPVACGMALHAKNSGKNHRIFCVVSDGDLDEGSTWEAIMLAAQHKFNNLCMIVDYNRLQALGRSEDIIDLEELDEKLNLFRWNTTAVQDGHDYAQIYDALKDFPHSDKPQAVICHTIKGKNVSFMENDYRWHYGPITEELYKKAVTEVEAGK